MDNTFKASSRVVVFSSATKKVVRFDKEVLLDSMHFYCLFVAFAYYYYYVFNLEYLKPVIYFKISLLNIRFP